MTNEFPSSKIIEPNERVGVLLVHGIGKQRQFEHLLEICRHISHALSIDLSKGKLQTEVLVKTKPEGPYAAQSQTWSAYKAPITIRARNRLGLITDIEFHEVWWADLGEPTTVATFSDFWFWGASLWSKRRYIENLQVDYTDRMRLPCTTLSTDGCSKTPPKLGFLGRLSLFGLSWIALIIMPVISVINRTLSVLGLQIARLDTISQYLSRTKIFSQQQRKSLGPITDADHPPRIGIRRRMVQATVKMALLNYDRWYILAHSQGTILAFNSLMETEQNLPNYLDQKLWQQAVKKLYKKAKDENQQAKGRMRPHRPDWLHPDDLLDRTKLFEKLRGFITYGSPLSKFAKLWPAIVQLNKDECVFQKNFEWINIYDPTDPVAGSVEQFFKPSLSNTDTNSLEKIPPTPKDYAYKAKYWHLFSHTNYLTSEPNRRDGLINELVRWILTEEEFNKNKTLNILSKKNSLKYDIIRILTWWIIGFACTAILSFTVKLLPISLMPNWHEPNLSTGSIINGIFEHIRTGILFGILGAVFIFLFGIVGIIHEYRLTLDINQIQYNILELLQQNPNQEFNIDQIKEKVSIYKNETKEFLISLKKLNEKRILEVLKKMDKERIIKVIQQLDNEKYVFPVVTFKVSPDITEDENSRNIMNTYQKAICSALDNQLNYAPDNEETFLNKKAIFLNIYKEVSFHTIPRILKTIKGDDWMIERIIERLRDYDWTGVMEEIKDNDWMIGRIGKIENRDCDWVMLLSLPTEYIYLYYNLENYKNKEIVITKIELYSKNSGQEVL